MMDETERGNRSSTILVKPSRADLLFAALVPTLVIVIDLATGAYGLTGVRLEDLTFALLLVAKVALLSVVVGRCINAGWLRLTVLVWSIALLDLAAFIRYVHGQREFFVALVMAELGAVVFWAMLSDTRWVWRLPAVLVSAAAILPMCVLGFNSWMGATWLSLLVLGLVGQGAAYLVLSYRGYRLTRTPTEAAQTTNTERGFAVGHIIWWSAALALLLAIARRVNWEAGFWVQATGRFFAEAPKGLLLSSLFALLGVTAVWVVFEKRLLIVRLLLILAASAGAVLALEAWSAEELRTRWTRGVGGTFPYSFGWLMADMREGWTVWLLLAFGTLIALLLFFRTSGYRLHKLADGAQKKTPSG